MIRPGTQEHRIFSAERGGVPCGFDVYLGTQGRLVAQNIFLDGTHFKIVEASIKKSSSATLWRC